MGANILILNPKVPFTRGGADALVNTLADAIKARGHNVDLIEMPMSAVSKDTILSQALLWRALDLRSFSGLDVDLVIATKFPSYFAKAKAKSVWLVHQRREIYDLYGTRFSDFCDDPRDEELRKMLYESDYKVLSEADYIAGISTNVVNRLRTYNKLDAHVLYPPLPLGDRYKTAPAEDYILSVGRVCSIKRVDMMLKALPIIHNFVKLKIAGSADEAGVMEYFKNEIDKHHLWDRVEFLGRVNDETLLDLYAHSLAVYYAPFDEDYGYVTLEAFASSKPVITAEDSGGVLEFVTHDLNGLVLEPNIDAIGHGINRLVENKDWAATMGREGRSLVNQLGILGNGWDSVVNGLLSPLSKRKVSNG